VNRRRLIWLVLLSASLVLIVTTASAFLRLSQTGLGCADWPACYGSPTDAQLRSSREDLVRSTHRLAAAGLVVFLGLTAFFGWKSLAGWRTRGVLTLLLALTAFLAWLGRLTPSTLPAVTLGNLGGGFLMLGLLAWLGRTLSAAARFDASLRCLAAALLVLACSQIHTGAALSSRLAALACDGVPLCAPDWGHVDWAVFDPWVRTGMEPVSLHTGRALQALHRLTGAFLVLGALGLAWRAWRCSRAIAGSLAALALAQPVLGAFAVLMPRPLGWAVAHNAAAAALVAVLFAVMANARAPQDPGTAARQSV
jgi:cytochrome c oxidase assembly protein subunit 15